MTKVDIFSGFLGAGKTTLIKKLIKEAYRGQMLVVIENEFGQIGIDGGFLKEAGIEITEMNSGCICCSLVGDFGKALAKVKAEFDPDRILIEPSGVGKLSDVIRAVRDAGVEGLELGAFTTVIDASKCKMYMKNFAEFYRNQIEFASSIILSRTDGIKKEKLDEAVEIIRSLNANAPLITTPWDQLDGKAILETMENKNTLEEELRRLIEEEKEREAHHHHHHHHDDGEECDDPDCECHHHHHDDDEDEHEHHHHHHDGHDADEVFTSWGSETHGVFTASGIEDRLDELMTGRFGMVLRAKGIVQGDGGSWIHFDYVPGEKEVRTGAADVTGKVCVIGTGLDKEGLRALFTPEN
ncbi:MAG: GTP-binding protein [Clostridia bacterium]|nr:GTP-binding protein [Clostridia bacterium]